MLRNGQYQLAVRLVNISDVMYLNISKMTEQQYDSIFVKKSKDEKSIDFREKCNGYITKCERIYSSLQPFSKEKFRELFYKEEHDRGIPKTLLLKDLFMYYVKEKEGIKIRTRERYKTSSNIFESFKKNVTVSDITPAFLKSFEEKKRLDGCSLSIISSYIIDLRTIINYFRKVVTIIPSSYEYPFTMGRYSIPKYTPKKVVLRNEEIQRFIDYEEFGNKYESYARDIWVLLYNCNGINFVDLLRMKWENVKGEYFVFFRMKTEKTRRINVQEITAWISPETTEILKRIGVQSSPYIIGKLQERYTESMFNNKCKKMRKEINKSLKILSDRLHLTVPIKIKSARDCFATTLNRAGVPITQISESLGHSNTVVTMNYLGSMTLEDSKKINQNLIVKTR